jgi:hypothetical protein
MVDKQYALLPTLDKIFTEHEKILLKTLTSSDQHDYTSVVLPVSFIVKYKNSFLIFVYIDS